MLRAFPQFIEIQTTSACNAACRVCPHPEVAKERRGGRMSDELFRSIVDQSVAHQDNVVLIPYLNGEPLLDTRLAERLEYCRDVCPQSPLEISTNVSLLSEKWRRKLTPIRIDDVRLSVFGFTRETHQRMMPGLDFDVVMENLWAAARDDDFRESLGVVGVVLLDHPLVTSEDRDLAKSFCAEFGFSLYEWGVLDRARNTSSFTNKAFTKKIIGCEQRRDVERLHILYNGSVVLCCQDWRAEVVLGNLNETSIHDLWNGDTYKQVRERISSGLPGAAPRLCQVCKLAVSA